MEQNTPLQAAVKAQRSMGMKGDNWDNYAIARYTLEGELGMNGQTAQHVYDLNQDEYNTLLANGRQDELTRFAILNRFWELNGRISRQLRFANVLLVVSVCFLGAIVLNYIRIFYRSYTKAGIGIAYFNNPEATGQPMFNSRMR